MVATLRPTTTPDLPFFDDILSTSKPLLSSYLVGLPLHRVNIELTVQQTDPSTMAGGPAPFKPHVPGIYKFAGTALGASMWFFVSPIHVFFALYSRQSPADSPPVLTIRAVDVPGEERW